MYVFYSVIVITSMYVCVITNTSFRNYAKPYGVIIVL